MQHKAILVFFIVALVAHQCSGNLFGLFSNFPGKCERYPWLWSCIFYGRGTTITTTTTTPAPVTTTVAPIVTTTPLPAVTTTVSPGVTTTLAPGTITTTIATVSTPGG